jgi:putative acetyltransferase
VRVDGFVIEVDDPRRDDVRRLVEQHRTFASGVTPAESVHALAPEELVDERITLFSLRVGTRLLAIGAIKQFDADHAELKTMHTTIAARRRGAGRAMLDHLLAVAAARGIRRVNLETGVGEAFAPAQALYAAAGFVPCAPFGDYAASPNNVFMTRFLGVPE